MGKQLGLGQYRLNHLLDLDLDSGNKEAEYLLEPRPDVTAGTVQDKISDVGNLLNEADTRYEADVSGPDYDQFEQATLDVGVPVEMEQAELSVYTDATTQPTIAD